jgi:hypothetical protein
MTTRDPDLGSTAKDTGMVKWLVNSMWVFWFSLLFVSMGLATIVYYVWLKGNV